MTQAKMVSIFSVQLAIRSNFNATTVNAFRGRSTATAESTVVTDQMSVDVVSKTWSSSSVCIPLCISHIAACTVYSSWHMSVGAEFALRVALFCGVFLFIADSVLNTIFVLFPHRFAPRTSSQFLCFTLFWLRNFDRYMTMSLFCRLLL